MKMSLSEEHRDDLRIIMSLAIKWAAVLTSPQKRTINGEKILPAPSILSKPTKDNQYTTSNTELSSLI